MKRSLAICVMLGLLGLGAWGTEFSGDWETSLSLLPSPALEETSLELTYGPVAGWSFTSTSTSTGEGFTDQLFQASGALGAFQIEASLDFSPIDETLRDISYVIPDAWTGLGYDLTIFDSQWTLVGPHVKEATLDVSWGFAGISLGLGVSWQGNHTITLGADGVVGEYLFYLDIPPYELGDDTWILQPNPDLLPRLHRIVGNCYSKYFTTYSSVGLVATKVTFEVRDRDTDELLFSHTVTGEFEVYYYDDATDTVILTLGADTYLWQYFNNYLTTHGITFPGTYYMYYTVDPADVEVAFLFPSYMAYTLTVDADPVSAEVVFDDVCTGIQFKEATISLSDLSLCCGISYDAELAFNKCKGFDYLKFSVNDVFPICCGISFDMSVKFTTDAKTISLTPKFASIGEACFELYADLESDGGENADLYLNAIRVDGWKIRCELAECNYLELVSFLSPDKAEDYGYEDVFEDGEFEYAKLGFCGPGCCGGNYSVDLSVFFDDGGGLFGISRLGADMTIPVMSNFTVNSSFAVKTAGGTTLDVGWTFTF